MKKIIASILSVTLVMAGCASSSKDVTAAYTSPLQYQNYNCEQINAETLRIQGRVVELGGRLDQAAANDKALVGVGLVLFWPALFALGGTKAVEGEYARLKGEHEALQKAAIEKKCVAPTPAPVTEAPAKAS